MHGMLCNCSLQYFFASFCLSADDGTASATALLLLLPFIPVLVSAQGTKPQEVNSGDTLKEKIIDSWAGET